MQPEKGAAEGVSCSARHGDRALFWKLMLIIVLKILFLYALWHVVLQYQKVKVDTPMMTQRIFMGPSPAVQAYAREEK